MEELKKYPWTGHSAIMGGVKRDWQDVDAILSYFSSRGKKALLLYEQFLSEGIALGKRPELVGGGLVRSLGGWSAVLSLRRKDLQAASDERVLGSSEFVSEGRTTDQRNAEIDGQSKTPDGVGRRDIKRSGDTIDRTKVRRSAKKNFESQETVLPDGCQRDKISGGRGRPLFRCDDFGRLPVGQFR